MKSHNVLFNTGVELRKLLSDVICELHDNLMEFKRLQWQCENTGMKISEGPVILALAEEISGEWREVSKYSSPRQYREEVIVTMKTLIANTDWLDHISNNCHDLSSLLQRPHGLGDATS